MSTNLPFERRLAAWMTDEAATGAPDGAIEEALSVTSRLRPRPRWLALLRETPMQTQSRVLVGWPARRLAIAGALALLIIVVAVVAGAVLLTRAGTDDWPMLRGGADRSSVAQTGPAGNGIVRWRLQAGSPFTNSPAIVGEVAYAASADGVVHAVRITDGHELWSSAIKPAAGSDATVGDGRIYVTNGSGAVVGLDAASGAQRWTSAALISPSSIAFADGSLFVGTGDGSLVSLDASTGAQRWRHAVAGATGAVHNPAVGDGRVYASADGGPVVAVSAATGAPVWNVDIGTDSTGTAVVVDGVLYIGAGGDATTGHLVAFAASTGKKLWQVDGAFGAPAVSNGVAYTTIQPQGILAALDSSTGKQRWRVDLPSSTRAPAVAGSIVYIAADSARAVYAIDAARGEFLWSVPIDDGNQCCIAVARGLVVAGTPAGSLYGIAGDGRAVQPAPLPLQTAANTPAVPATPGATPYIVLTGALRWSVKGPDDKWGPTTLALDAAGHIWASDPNNHRFTIFDQDGKFLESWGTRGTAPGEFNLQRANGNGYGTVAFASDGSFFVLDVGNHRVQAFDAKRRFVTSWGSFGSNAGQFLDPVGLAVAGDGTVYVVDDERGVIEHYDRNGKVLGSFNAFPNAGSGLSAANSLAIDSAGNLYVSDTNPGQIDKFDPAGKLLATYGAPGSGTGQITGQPNWMAIDAKGRLYVSTVAVMIYESDGTFVGQFGTAAGDTNLRIPGGLLLLDGDLVVADVADFDQPNGRGRLLRLQLLPPLAP